MNAFANLSSKQKKLYTAMLLLSLAAVAVTSVLIWVHFVPSSAGSFCDINDYWNCDRVNKSIFADIMGIPVSFMGLAFYIFLSIVLAVALKGVDLTKKFSILIQRWFFALTVGVTTLGSIFLIFMETPFLGNLAAFVIIKNLVFTVLYLMLFFNYNSVNNPRLRFNAWLAVLTLFGVNFSLYLTDIELFVLNSICVFCLTQQIIIIIISGLSLYELKQMQHEHTQSSQQ